MAKNRMTFEKSQREAAKKRKAAEKRARRLKRKEQEKSGTDPNADTPSVDESDEN